MFQSQKHSGSPAIVAGLADIGFVLSILNMAALLSHDQRVEKRVEEHVRKDTAKMSNDLAKMAREVSAQDKNSLQQIQKEIENYIESQQNDLSEVQQQMQQLQNQLNTLTRERQENLRNS